MTRKDYEMIAKVFSDHRKEYAQHGDTKEVADKCRAILMVAADLAREMSKDNASFDSDRFIMACLNS